MGARVSFSKGKPKVTEGPFAEAKELVGGYWVIQVKSKEGSDRDSPRVRSGIWASQAGVTV